MTVSDGRPAAPDPPATCSRYVPRRRPAPRFLIDRDKRGPRACPDREHRNDRHGPASGPEGMLRQGSE